MANNERIINNIVQSAQEYSFSELERRARVYALFFPILSNLQLQMLFKMELVQREMKEFTSLESTGESVTSRTAHVIPLFKTPYDQYFCLTEDGIEYYEVLPQDQRHKDYPDSMYRRISFMARNQVTQQNLLGIVVDPAMESHLFEHVLNKPTDEIAENIESNLIAFNADIERKLRFGREHKLYPSK